MSAGKIKLRTAGDVINRLRWSEEEDPALILMGYEDRINGPMEKSIADYKTIDDGGDIPQHRIQYFRRVPQEGQGMNMNQLILWDREGRVDRLFGSGLGSRAPASPDTIKMAFDAIANMIRIAEYQEMRRQEKAKQRARRQRKVQAKINAENQALAAQLSSSTTSATAASDSRFQWSNVDWFDFSRPDSQWRQGTTASRTQPSKKSESRRLRFVTWNVLFDKYQAETALFEGDNAMDRWSLAIRLLGEADADLIALQEVTPGFIGLLCESTWVQEQYSISAAPIDTSSINPYGNIFLWRRASLKPVSKSLGVSMLVDGTRKRSVVACLQSVQEPSTVLVCACVHLPCDAKAGADKSERLSRATARRRELNTVVGKLQALETELQSAATKSVVPLLLGDFNSDEKIQELEDGGFMASGGSAGIFTDVWPLVSNGQDGHTYNPQENKRASFSVLGPRRIDRICVGKGASEPALPLRPLDGGLLGVELPTTEDVPPSDHYGLSVLFELPANPNHPKCCKPLLGHGAWARTVMPTTDTLLALTLGDSPLENTPLLDPDSSLPVPHITLLNGFAELMCQETRDLAMEAVSTAVEQTLASVERCDIPFSRDSLTVFEHRSSATLVCTPDGPCQWLQTLYQTLRASFRFCDEQESRFLEGWSPHVSMGKFGSESDARQEANRLVSSGSWFQERCFLPAQAVVIYQRDQKDRKFYATTSIPLEQKPKNVHSCDPKEFLGDAGASLSSYFLKHSSPFVSNIERICKATIDDMTAGNLEAKLTKYGSCKFHASLPTISDIDAVVELFPKHYSDSKAMCNVSPSAYLHNVGAALKSIHPSAKIRMRIAGTNGVALHFLTLKLNASAPSVDLMVCLRNSAGETVDTMGSAANSSINDCQMILNQLNGDSGKVFEGALRLCKIWAYRRQIYGAPLGYLGGGGWALLIARAMTKGLRDGDLQFASCANDSLGIGKAAMEVLSYTFQQTAKCWSDGIIALDGTTICEEVKEQTLARCTVSVIAPASGGNFARNATRSTAAVVAKEIQRANTILSECADGEVGALFLQIKQDEFLSEGSSILFLEVATGELARAEGAPCLPEIKAWAARQVLQLLVALESGIGNADLIRPFARPVRIKGKLVYIVRIARVARDLDSFLRKNAALVQEEANNFLRRAGDEGNSVVRLRCFTACRFCQAFA